LPKKRLSEARDRIEARLRKQELDKARDNQEQMLIKAEDTRVKALKLAEELGKRLAVEARGDAPPGYSAVLH
jgi:predicted Holliday junction resolvase-like endonuclease